MKRNLLLFVVASLSLLSSCSPRPTPSVLEDDTADEKADCRTHDDCAPEEICFFDGLCAKPWGSSFLLSKCSFDGPTKDDFPDCMVQCMLKDSASSGGVAQWTFSHKKWDECDFINSLQAVQHGIEILCGYAPTEKGVECPDFHSHGSMCLSDGCPGFRMEHYRSEKVVELGNGSGYTLKFWLEPEPD